MRECQKCKDSLDYFEAWNSSRNITNSSKELDFVMDLFETSEGWQEKDPEDWKPTRINCNLKSQTIEKIKGHRQKEILVMLPYLDGALRSDMLVLVEALAAELKEKAEEETQLKKLQEIQAQISKNFDALSIYLATPGKMNWLNEDSNCKQSICEVIDFKNHSLSKLVKELSALDDEDFLHDPFITGLHVAAREGRTKTVTALLSIGADIAAKDQAGNTAVELVKYTHTIEVLKAGVVYMPEIPDQKKDDLLIAYARKDGAGGVLIAIHAGANVNHKDSEEWTSTRPDATTTGSTVPSCCWRTPPTLALATSGRARRSTRPHTRTSSTVPSCCCSTPPTSTLATGRSHTAGAHFELQFRDEGAAPATRRQVRPTGRPRRTSLPLECHRKTTTRGCCRGVWHSRCPSARSFTRSPSSPPPFFSPNLPFPRSLCVMVGLVHSSRTPASARLL